MTTLHRLTRREWTVVATAILSSFVPTAIHLFGWYHWNANVDSVAHLFGGVGVGGVLYAVIALLGVSPSRWRDIAVVLCLFAVGWVWELYEALPRPWGYGYVDRWFTPLYINDTTADMALVMTGGLLVVWLGVNYRDRKVRRSDTSSSGDSTDAGDSPHREGGWGT